MEDRTSKRFSLSGDLLSAIISTIDEGIIVHDKEGKVVVFNRQAQQILKSPEDELLGKTVYEFPCPMIKPDGSRFSPEEYPASITLRTGEDRQGIRMGVVKNDNDIVWISINSKAMAMGPASYVFITLNDITPYINANRELNDIIDTIDDIVFEISTTGRLLNVWTSDAEKLFVPREMIVGKTISDLFPPAFTEKMLMHFNRTIKTGQEEKTEYQNPFDPEDKRWFQARFRKTKNQDDTVTLLIKEITEKKKAEAEILEFKDRLLVATKAAGVGVWEWDLRTDRVIWDDNMRRIFRWEEAGSTDESEVWKRMMHPADKDRIIAKMKLAITEKREFEDEFKIIWPNGEMRFIKANSATVISEDEVPVKVIGTNWDITELTTKKRELLESQLTFKNTFEYSSIGIALVSIDGRWLEVNDALVKLLGYSQDEFMGRSFQDITHPDDLEADLAYVAKMLKGEIDTYQMEKRYFNKNGDVIWVLLSVSLVRNLDGTPKFFIAQIIDITQNKRLIVELEDKNKVLETTTKDLEQKIKQLQEFSHIIAHNLRGPATGLMAISEMILTAENDQEREFMFDQLKEKSELIISTLNDLKDVVEMRLNKKDIAFNDCSFEQTVAAIEKILEHKIKEKGAVIETDLKVDGIHYPKAYFDSIIYNLVSNAVKYTKQDRQPVIKIKSYKDNERIALEVIDNGLGIDMTKYGNQVFKYKKIFHRGFDSTGLGLFITKNQIETFGGSISLESEPDKGSVFKVVFNES